MVRIPAHCTKCGHVFEPRGGIIFGGEVRHLVMKGNISRCPKCGGAAEFIEGKFDISSDTIIPIEAPPITFAILDKIRKVVDEAKTKAATSEDLIAEIEPLSPALAAALRPLAKRKTTAILIAIILLVLHQIHVNVNYNIDAKIDVNELVAQIIQAAESHEPKPKKAKKHAPRLPTKNDDLSAMSPSRPENKQGQPRRRLPQPELRSKKKQGKLGLRWRRKRHHRYGR